MLKKKRKKDRPLLVTAMIVLVTVVISACQNDYYLYQRHFKIEEIHMTRVSIDSFPADPAVMYLIESALSNCPPETIKSDGKARGCPPYAGGSIDTILSVEFTHNSTTSRGNAFQGTTQPDSDSQTEDAIYSSGETYYVINMTQVSTTQLIGTKWEEQYSQEGGMTTTWEFASDQIVQKTIAQSWTSEYVSPFYITDTEPKTFDKSLVGKNSTGYYLAKCVGKDKQRLDWYTVMEFDLAKGKMTLFRKVEPDEVGGGDATIHLELISKPTHAGGRK